MNKTIFRKTSMLFVSLLLLMSFATHLPSTCYAQEPCPLEVDVSPYQVNIDSGGAEHYVRILTYARYSNTGEVFVYINGSEDPIDREYIVLTRDSVGHLVVKIDLVALQDAGLAPETVDFVNAHGTSTRLNDPVETRAIRRVFGPHADRLAVSSTKSMVGHLMGAAGAVEAIACVKSLETGWVHPTVNYEYPDPECDLDYVPNQARYVRPRVALSNSFGFGGHNSCLIFRRRDETV